MVRLGGRATSIAAPALLLCAVTVVALVVMRAPAEPTELYYDYDAPDETFAKQLNLDPDSLQAGNSGKTLDQEVAWIQKTIAKEAKYQAKLKQQTKKAAPVAIQIKVGRKGPPGTRGPKGYRGPPGAQGATGAAGARGPRGNHGPRGQRGPRGPVGGVGPRGYNGPRGPVGSPGDAGRPGRFGRDGRQGPIGLPGFPGHHGRAGKNGPTGPAGRGGARGRPGPRGPPGPPGVLGKRGRKGPQGQRGVKGPKGVRGSPGTRGRDGRNGGRGRPGKPFWRLAMRSRQNNNNWHYTSSWWTNKRAYNTHDRTNRKNMKRPAFWRVRVRAIKIELNRRTYVFSLPSRLQRRYTLRDLVTRRGGLQLGRPRWAGTRLDVFGLMAGHDPNGHNRFYCDNFAAHYTPYYQANIDSKGKRCGAVARLGAVLSSSAACRSRNRVSPKAAEGLGVWYQCKNYNKGSGRVDSRGKNAFVRATVWVL